MAQTAAGTASRPDQIAAIPDYRHSPTTRLSRPLPCPSQSLTQGGVWYVFRVLEFEMWRACRVCTTWLLPKRQNDEI